MFPVLNIICEKVAWTSLKFLNSTLQMLTAIESRMEELFDTVESLPADKVEAAEKVWIATTIIVLSLWWPKCAHPATYTLTS